MCGVSGPLPPHFVSQGSQPVEDPHPGIQITESHTLLGTSGNIIYQFSRHFYPISWTAKMSNHSTGQ